MIRRSNGWLVGRRDQHNAFKRSSAVIGAASSSNQAGLLAFRIIVITIILFCLVWFYFILQLASSIDHTTHQIPTLIARPRIENPNASRTGWIRNKVKQIQFGISQHTSPLLDVSQMDSPVLILTCERAEYLERTLWKIFEHHPAHQEQQQQSSNDGKLGNLRDPNALGDREKRRIVGAPIIISQDGTNTGVKAVIETYQQLFEMKLGVPLYRIEHTPPIWEKPENGDPWDWDDHEWEKPYKLLAMHYGWALDQTFSGDAYKNSNIFEHSRHKPQPPLPQRVIILEEDIEIAPDFFCLMNATADLLDSDSSLLAVSAFNDNGKESLVADPKRLARTDFFSGLGWMMPRHVWFGPPHHPNAGLKGKWAPNGFWDDWIREPDIRRGRQILRPEVSRTFHFGNVKGASSGEATMKLSKIHLDHVNVRWDKQDLSYLEASAFAESYWTRVSTARLVQSAEEARSFVAHSDVRIVYSDWKQFKWTAESLGIMQDEKAGVPRTAYEGIVEIRYGSGLFFIFLTPPCLNEMAKPADFGLKAWMKIDKELLLAKLGVSTKTDDGFSFDVGYV